MMKFDRFDVVKGTVTDKRYSGVNVKVEGLDAECFCKCNMQTGDVGLFTIKWFVQSPDKLRVTLDCDSVLEYGPIAC